MLTVNDAVAMRITKLLLEKEMTQYRLEQKTGIAHGSMQCIMNGRNKNVTLGMLIAIAAGFEMTVSEFLDDELFCPDKVDLDK